MSGQRASTLIASGTTENGVNNQRHEHVFPSLPLLAQASPMARNRQLGLFQMLPLSMFHRNSTGAAAPDGPSGTWYLYLYLYLWPVLRARTQRAVAVPPGVVQSQGGQLRRAALYLPEGKVGTTVGRRHY